MPIPGQYFANRGWWSSSVSWFVRWVCGSWRSWFLSSAGQIFVLEAAEARILIPTYGLMNLRGGCKWSPGPSECCGTVPRRHCWVHSSYFRHTQYSWSSETTAVVKAEGGSCADLNRQIAEEDWEKVVEFVKSNLQERGILSSHLRYWPYWG